MRSTMTLLAALVLTGCASDLPVYRDTEVRLTSLAAFDAEKYAGRWQEAARFPFRFQSGCVATAASYSAPIDGRIDVTNTCRRLDGSETRIEGRAEIDGPGRLKLRLAGQPFASDYWVLWADDSYETAVVGVPSGRAGWILSRELPIREDRLEAALNILRFNGYDTEALVFGAEGAP